MTAVDTAMLKEAVVLLNEIRNALRFLVAMEMGRLAPEQSEDETFADLDDVMQGKSEHAP